MPMTLNVGWQRKMGQPDYGSLCASCSVAVELNGSMVFDDLEGFHRHVRQAFVACQQAVNDQLARQQQGEPALAAPAKQPAPQAENAASPNGNGSTGNGNGAANGHQASEKQMSYIQQLSQIRGLGVRRLEALASRMFSKPMVSLTSFEASSLIDTLKAIKAGEISLDQALNGAATS